MTDVLKELDEVLAMHDRQRDKWLRLRMPAIHGNESIEEWRRQRAHLVSLGYLEHMDPGSYIAGEAERWRITVHGQLFLAQGGFRGERCRMRRRQVWMVVKTVATVIYSLAVLYVAAWVAWKEFGEWWYDLMPW